MVQQTNVSWRVLKSEERILDYKTRTFFQNIEESTVGWPRFSQYWFIHLQNQSLINFLYIPIT